MGRLDAIQAALDAAGSTAADEAVQVSEHFNRLHDQIADLQDALANMSAGSVTDEEIAALQAQADALSVTIESIDTEGEGVEEPPVEEPPIEEPPIEEPPIEDETPIV